jgi:hypothetical protein
VSHLRTEIFVLCDAATDNFGKLNLLGTFDIIGVPQVPFAYPACALALRIRFDALEDGEHTIRLRLIDEDGRSIGPAFEVKVTIHIPSEVSYLTHNAVFNLQQLGFPKTGEYTFELAIDGRHEDSLPLRVVIAQPQQGSQLNPV